MNITPFLMFTGQCEEAVNFYTGLLDDSKILEMKRYGAEEMGEEGTVERVTFTLCGQTFMAIDSPPVHEFSFTPSTSFFLECDRESIDHLFAELSRDGQVLMALDTYPFSEKYGWCNDRFGVSWQVSMKLS